MGFIPNIPPLFAHQRETIDMARDHLRMLDLSDPGTGKTRSWLEVIAEERQQGGGKALVLAPKSILQAAWEEDAKKYLPGLKTSIAYASNREKAFQVDADVYITNHDAVKWVARHPEYLKGFRTLIIDESTAYKHATSQRSKACRSISQRFERRAALTGTIASNGILDVWHQVYLIDHGERLGDSYYRFRAQVCEPKQVGPSPNMVKWVDRPGYAEAVTGLLSDITIRHIFEECVDIPENTSRFIFYDLPARHHKVYGTLENTCLLELEQGEITAINAAQLASKLLQTASGAVYDESGTSHLVDTGRYELVIQLVQEREASIVAFQWKHQRDQLEKLAKKEGIRYAVIDGETPVKAREAAVRDFQMGGLQALFCHPASAGHGLTLTRGVATIWASPTYNSEHYIQFNRRIYRAGQKHKTETIHVCARDTVDEKVYKTLDSKVSTLDLLMECLS